MKDSSVANEFQIGRVVASDTHTVVIAEAGVNHLGRMDYARKLVEAAARAGAEIIKFQTYKAEKLTTKDAPRFWSWSGESDAEGSQYDSYSQLDSFGLREYSELRSICDEVGIEFMSTPFDNDSVDLLMSVGVNGFKIASCDINNFSLISKICSTQLPILLSTGASTILEIRKAVDFIEERTTGQLCIMHCSLCYPTEIDDAQLGALSQMRSEFPKLTLGYSDHTLGVEIASASTLLGARFIEKHFTFDKSLPMSADHWLSADESELGELTRRVRLYESAFGSGRKDVQPCEELARNFARRSLVANRDIAAGQVLSLDDLTAKRPGTGMAPDRTEELVGKCTLRDLKRDEMISLEDVRQIN